MRVLLNPLKMLLLVFPLMLVQKSPLYAQTQKGIDIDGEAAEDFSGWVVSMPDKHTIAIGAPFNDGNGMTSGHVRVYSWSGNAWTQKGSDMDGEATLDYSGWSLSMPDSNTVAIGAYQNSGGGNASGHVRIYSWNGNDWVQKGNDIDGESSGDGSGHAVSMPDANTVAIGATSNSGINGMAGHCRVFVWDGSTWVQKGNDIDGEAYGDIFGSAVSMPDENTVAIGGLLNDGIGTDAGHVRVFRWNQISSDWQQMGPDINGESAGDYFGASVSMPDSMNVAVGGYRNSGNGVDAGHVRVFTWNGSLWIQKGSDIDGETPGDRSGATVSMPDSETIAIGALRNDGNGTDAGQARVYTWNAASGNWVQKGMDMDGEASLDEFGLSVSMPDSNTIGIGGYLNDGNGNNSGHARIYEFVTGLGIPDNELLSSCLVYPNPFHDKLHIDLAALYKVIKVSISNVLGQLILEQNFKNATKVDLNINAAAGFYYLNIIADDRSAVFKIAKD